MKQMDAGLRYSTGTLLADISGPNQKGNKNKTNAAYNINETFSNAFPPY